MVIIIIIILVRGNLKAQPHSFNERMWNIEVYSNDVNRIGANSEGVASGRCPVEQQHRPGRLLATAERQLKSLAWSKEDNKRLFKCYIRDETEKRGYRKRLLDLWKTHNSNNELTEVTEHRLANQVRQIKHKTWLETVEQEEITLRVNNKHQSIEAMEPNTTDTLHHAAITPDIQEKPPQRVYSKAAEEEPGGSPAEEPQDKVNPELDVLRGRIQELMQSDKRVYHH